MSAPPPSATSQPPPPGVPPPASTPPLATSPPPATTPPPVSSSPPASSPPPVSPPPTVPPASSTPVVSPPAPPPVDPPPPATPPTLSPPAPSPVDPPPPAAPPTNSSPPAATPPANLPSATPPASPPTATSPPAPPPAMSAPTSPPPDASTTPPPPTSSPPPPVAYSSPPASSPPPPDAYSSPPATPPTSSPPPPDAYSSPPATPPTSSPPPPNAYSSPPATPPTSSPPPPDAYSSPPATPPISASPPTTTPPPAASYSPPSPSTATPSPPPSSPPASPPTSTPSPPPPSPPPPASNPPASPPTTTPSPPPPSGSSPPAPTPSSTRSSPPPKNATPPATSPSNSTSAVPPTSPPPPPGTGSSPPAVSPSGRSPPPPPGVLVSPAASPPGNSTASTAAVSNTSSPSGLSTGVIAGIAAGGGSILLFSVLFLVWFGFWRRKTRRREDFLPIGGMGARGGSFKPGGGADSSLMYGAAGGSLRQPLSSGGGGGGGGGGVGGGGGGVGVPLPPAGTGSGGNSRSWFTFGELQAATNDFAKENLLGEGGFGRVYKGQLANGQMIAVKQLTVGGGQGDREFRAEVEIIGRVHHRHLVSLVGYCIVDKQRLLVYDFVPNGTLDVNLYGDDKPVMSWELRLRVAVGAARGLAYLHEDCHPRIIHRDIKSSNILLDDKYEAQVSDFGLARLASDTHSHVSTRVMGTFGYLAPEYAQSGKLTEKSDVYSFGVVLLELISGRKPVDSTQPAGQESLVEWARPLMTVAMDDGDFNFLVDPRLGDNYDTGEMFRMIEAAASCVRHSASKRPRMSQVVRALESEEANVGLYQGLKPGLSSEHDSDFGGSKFSWSSAYDTQQYNADMLRAQNLALSSRTFGSENTGEFGGNPQYSSESEGVVDGSHSNRSIGEPVIKGSFSGQSLSGRSGQRSRTSIPPGRSRMSEGFSGAPPQRDPPPRSGLLRSGLLSEFPVQVENSRSDRRREPLPLPQTSSEEFAPAESTSSEEHAPIKYHLGDGR